jgi:hypothetical protein
MSVIPPFFELSYRAEAAHSTGSKKGYDEALIDS